MSLLAGFVLVIVRRSKKNLVLLRSNSLVAAFVIGFALLLPGGIIYATTIGSSTIAIGNGYFSVSGQFLDNSTYTKSQIKTAFIDENINSGNLTLTTRNEGTSLGNINVGIYTLSNGASAHVVSVNQTDLIIELNSGPYLVLGTSNTNALVTAFSADVIPVS